jgi:phosphate transport system permease protein
MTERATFTGRKRPTQTRVGVLFGDQLARLLITLGGLGTIAAVLLVGVFLLAVALPLFRSGTISFDHALQPPPAAAHSLAAGSDESGCLAWFCNAEQIDVIELKTGRLLLSRPTVVCGLEDATALRALPIGLEAVAGYRDGTIRSGRLGLESTFAPIADLPAATRELSAGESISVDDRIYLRNSNGTTTLVKLVAEFNSHTSQALSQPIVDVDLAVLSGGPCIAAVDATGQIRVEKLSSRRNLLTDELITSADGSTIAPQTGQPQRQFVRVTGLGDQLFVFGKDGRFERHLIREVDQPSQLEKGELLPAGLNVTAVTRLFGGSAFVIGDNVGTARLLFTTRSEAAAEDGLATVVAKTFPPPVSSRLPSAITAIVASPRSRLFGVGRSDGSTQLQQATNGETVLRIDGDGDTTSPQPAEQLIIAPRENRLVAATAAGLSVWSFTPGYPEVSLRALFGKLWYENYPQPVYAWETTGHESFEPKLSLVPLIFGTIKATLYSMLFATPIALLAAIYASQFMHARWKARIKPTIEMMASLPSVVLGFVAGLIFAPLIEQGVMVFLSCFFTVPLALLLGAHLWQLWPSSWRSRVAGWRFLVVLVVALPVGLLAGWLAAAPLEQFFFGGDIFAWLNGRGGSGWGGWMLALIPLAGVFAVFLVGRFASPWLRIRSSGWSHHRTAVVSLVTCLLGIAATLLIAAAAAMFFDALRLDTRGGLLGTYVQRNAIVVAIGMSFAIIPLVFTIADDALSSVPDHLRSASLGAGATPWQTTVRVIVPAATSGLFSAVMIGLGRAVGETMIVLMAAGNTPLMGWNIFNGFQTLSAAIATELPEAARGSAHYRVLFLAAVLLFAMTFAVNTIAEVVRQRFRRRSHEL